MKRGMRDWRRLLTGWMALLIFSGTGGCSGEARKTSHLERANRHYDQQQFEQARLEYINVLQLDPKHPQALHRLGVILYDGGQIPQAFAVLRQAQEVAPDNIDVRIKLARIYMSGGQMNEARLQAIAVLDKQPANEPALLILTDAAANAEQVKDAEDRLRKLGQGGDKAIVHLASANLALRRNDLKSAETELARAQALNPKSSLTHLALANLRWRQGQIPAAELAFKTAAELAPGDWQLQLRWADFNLSNGRSDQARKSVRGIVAKNPGHLPALFYLARVAFTEKKFDECAELLKRVQAANPADAEASLLRAQVSFAQGNVAEAVTELERLRDLYPKAARFHYDLAVGYLRAQSIAKALISLQQAVSIDPKFDPATLLLAELEIRRGDFAPAIRSLSELALRSPKLAQTHALLAEAYRAQNRLDEALAACARWKEAAPSPQAFYLTGLTLRQQRKDGEARAEFEQALSASPGFMAAAEQLTELDLAEKKGEAAVKRAESLVQAHSQSAVPLLLLARIHMAQGSADKAEPLLVKALDLDPNASAASLLLAQLYVSSGRRDEALRKLEPVVERNPGNISALLQIAWIQQDSKQYAKSRQTYEKVLAAQPKSVLALNNLAYICAEYLADTEAAYRYAQTARDLAPDDASIADTLGWILHQRGEHLRALPLLVEAAAKRPNTPEIQFHLGSAHYVMGDESQARIVLRRACDFTEDFPSRTRAQRLLAILDVNPESASPADAAKLKQALSANPQDTIALLKSGAIAEKDGASDEALNFYRTALKSSPKSTALLMRLAHFYAGPMRDFGKALEHGKFALELAPRDLDIAHSVGRFAREAGDYARAYVLLQECDEKRPNDPDILFDLALAGYGRGRESEAEEKAKRALGLNGAFPRADEATQFLELLALSRNAADAARAEVKVREIVRKAPDLVPALMVTALIEEHARRYPEAKQIYQERILKLNPGFAPAWRKVAFLCAWHLEDEPCAFDAGMKAREVFSDDPDLAKLLGEIAFRRKDYLRAAQLLSESARSKAPDAELLYRLGVAHLQLKQTEQGKRALQRALTLNPGSAVAADVNRALAELK